MWGLLHLKNDFNGFIQEELIGPLKFAFKRLYTKIETTRNILEIFILNEYG